jgi:hypothetical protein
MAWTPEKKTVIRSAYGIFFAFLDTNLVTNTVVTIPFVANSQLFNDRPHRRALSATSFRALRS